MCLLKIPFYRTVIPDLKCSNHNLTGAITVRSGHVIPINSFLESFTPRYFQDNYPRCLAITPLHEAFACFTKKCCRKPNSAVAYVSSSFLLIISTIVIAQSDLYYKIPKLNLIEKLLPGSSTPAEKPISIRKPLVGPPTHIVDNFPLAAKAKSPADLPPMPSWNAPPSSYVAESTPLFIGFTRNWRLLQQTVVSYITAGWPPRKHLFYIYTALERNWTHYFWAHMDTVIVSDEEREPFEPLYTRAVSALRETVDPKWGSASDAVVCIRPPSSRAHAGVRGCRRMRYHDSVLYDRLQYA